MAPRSGSALRRWLEPISNRLRLIASRAVIRALEDSTGVQGAQLTVLRGERMGTVERFQSYGFTSRPPEGAEAILLCLAGSRDAGVVIADEHREVRPRGVLAEGEALVYASGGARIHVRAGGVVTITAAGGVTVSANLSAGGDVTAGGDVADGIGTLDVLRQAYNVHTHIDGDGRVTSPPTPTV